MASGKQDKGMVLDVVWTPRGEWHCVGNPGKGPEAEALARWQAQVAVDPTQALLELGWKHEFTPITPGLSHLQQLAHIFVHAACQAAPPAPPAAWTVPFHEAAVQAWLNQAPFIPGIHCLNRDVAQMWWERMSATLARLVGDTTDGVRAYLGQNHADWHHVGRVCFHIVENTHQVGYPFAFFASYTRGISREHETQHIPLAQLITYGSGGRAALVPVSALPVDIPPPAAQQACMVLEQAMKRSVFLERLVVNHQLLKPLRWRAGELHQFYEDCPWFESCGIWIRLPPGLQRPHGLRPRLQVVLGQDAPRGLGMDAVLDFTIHGVLPSGAPLTRAEWDMLVQQTEPLVRFRGEWVQIDPRQLKPMAEQWQQHLEHPLALREGLQWMAGLDESRRRWDIQVGSWLREQISRGFQPTEQAFAHIKKRVANRLTTHLRPYQEAGLRWLWGLYSLQLGGCLADDMGLGKTIQILALWVAIQEKRRSQTHLLVVPASLLGNWQHEIARFAPSLRVYVAHRSDPSWSGDVEQPPSGLGQQWDVVITTYGTVARLPWLKHHAWDVLVLDEAQAIKNPRAQKTRLIKQLKARARFVLTGTPVENHAMDLWSLCDCILPGLLGSMQTFAQYQRGWVQADPQSPEPGAFYAAVRKIIQPYWLRRLKTDRDIIPDLPDKTELLTNCGLTQRQIVLYQQVVQQVAHQLSAGSEAIPDRRGMVLSAMVRLKQICNHPAHYHNTLLTDTTDQERWGYIPEHSGKFLKLQELAWAIAGRQEKLLVFTQFSEIIPALCELLTACFGRPGLWLDGQVAVADRAKRVAAFQSADLDGPGFFVLSLRAGGTGLNLTAASHVIHFDPWWNPAVAQQATDRAYRIGQHRNILVHHLMCPGTIETKIHGLLQAKEQLAEALMGAQDPWVPWAQWSDAELLDMLTLDLPRALQATLHADEQD